MNTTKMTNVVIVTGRLTKNAVTGTTRKVGTPFARFTVASDKKRTGKFEQAQSPNFYPIEVYGEDKLTAYEPFLKQGQSVAVKGSIRTDSYKGDDGKTVYTWKIIADEICALPGGKMTGMSQVFLLGELNDDAKSAYTRSHDPVCMLDMFIKCGRTYSGGSDYIPAVLYGKLGEMLGRYLVKGKSVICTGKLDTGSYKNSEGVTIYTWKVIADNIYLNGAVKIRDDKMEVYEVEESESGFTELPPEFDEDYFYDEEF